MSAFSSLLNQFKQATQQSTSSSSSPGGFPSAAATASETRKRSRPAINVNNNDTVAAAVAAPSKSHHHHLQGRDHSDKQKNQHRRRRLPSTPVNKIYIACPAFAETGGPEALHQLCHMINCGNYCPTSINSVKDDNAETIEVNNDDNDADNNCNDHSTEYDEFGRESKRQHRRTDDTTPALTAGRGIAQKEVAPTTRAYMLYLRERSTNSGGGAVEHIQSSRARSTKYDRYLAPPAPHLPGWGWEREGEERPVVAVANDNDDGEYSSEMVIWPECWTHLIDSLQPSPPNDDDDNFIDDDNNNKDLLLAERSTNIRRRRRRKYQIAIWWLSVNNNNGQFSPHQFATRCDVLHLAQSAYAREYVFSRLKRGEKKRGVEQNNDDNDDDDINLLSLTEFIPYASQTFSSATTSAEDDDDDHHRLCDHNDVVATTRDLDVVYNPAKGMHFTDEIIRRMCGGKKVRVNLMDGGSGDGGGAVGGVGGSIRFTPIGKGIDGRERMTGEEVVALLRRSKVVRVIRTLLAAP